MTPEELIAALDVVAEAPDGVTCLRKLVLSLALRGRLLAGEAAGAGESVQRASPPDAREIPFDIPSHWSWLRLPEVARYAVGRTPPTKDARYWGSDAIPWVSIGDMPDGGVVTRTARTVTEAAARDVFRCPPVPAGTILMSFKLTIGKVALLGFDAYHNEAIISIVPGERIDGRFLFTFLPLLAARGETKGAVKGETLNGQSLARILVPVPPLDEQRRIVARVETLMALLDRLEAARGAREVLRRAARDAALAALRDASDAEAVEIAWGRVAARMDDLFCDPEDVEPLRRVLLRLALGGRLVAPLGGDGLASAASPRGDEIPLDIPARWSWMRLPEVSDYAVGRTPPTKDPRYWASGAIPWVSIGDMQAGGVVRSTARTVTEQAARDVFRRPPAPAGTILMSFKLTIGKVALLGIDAYHNEAILSIVPRPCIDGRFLFTFLPLLAAGGETKEAVKGATLNGQSLARILVPVPPLAEQRLIVERLDALMSLCDTLEARLRAACEAQARIAVAVVHRLKG